MQTKHFIEQYDYIFCDICGVLHDYKAPLGHANKILESLKKPVTLISNASIPGSQVAVLLQKKFCINTSCFERIVTSSDYILYAQKKNLMPSLKNATCFVIPHTTRPLHDSLNIKTTLSLKEADFILTLQASDPQSNLLSSYAILHQAQDLNIPLISINGDLLIRSNGQKHLRPGLLAHYYSHIGGRAYIYGKPDPTFYTFAFGGTINQKVLCIGDGLTTDALGAKNIQQDFLLTASGVPALFFRPQDSFTQNIERLTRIYTVPIPYATWELADNNPIHFLKKL